MQKIISWNVASIRARLPALLNLLAQETPDFVLLQEIKATDENFPFFDLRLAGYEAVISGQKSYNGVAILAKTPMIPTATTLPGFEDQARFIQTEAANGLTLISVYVPNGTPPAKDPADTSRLTYKLAWLDALASHINALNRQGKSVILGGDFNVIARDSDVYDPAVFRGGALMNSGVQNALQHIENQEFFNMTRAFNPMPNTYTFWDFQGGSWPRNHGILLDLMLVNQPLRHRVAGAPIYRDVRGWPGTSDHAPIGLLLD